MMRGTVTFFGRSSEVLECNDAQDYLPCFGNSEVLECNDAQDYFVSGSSKVSECNDA